MNQAAQLAERLAVRAIASAGVLVFVLLLATVAAGQTTQPSGNTHGDVGLETAPAMTVLALPMTGSYSQHPAAIGQLMSVAGPAGIVRGAPFGVYPSDPHSVPEDALEWSVCVPISADATAEPPFELRQVPERQVAVVMCTGPYDGATPCYEALFQWMQQNGYQPAGPPEEHWISDPQTTPPESIQTRIVMPVAPQ